MKSNAPFSTVSLARLLRTIRRHGDFHARGMHEIAAPGLSVQGLGLLSLPFQESQLAPLLARAGLAPFGRGELTVTDTAVRKTWQIDAAQLSFGGRNWPASLDAIVASACSGLGVSEPVSAQLYKLLIYDTGSFFVEHRDTEKAPGMFATLVLVLPSLYSGGELLIRHGGREVCVDLAQADPADAAFVAFYADCVHEVRPVTSGARLALVYNLVRAPGKGTLQAPEHAGEVLAAGAELEQWLAALAAGEEAVPDKLVYPLEHAYSVAELGFGTLKNVDAAVAQVLAAAAAQAGCEVYLAQLAIDENGSAEYGDDWYGRRRRYGRDDDDGDFEIGEIIDRSATLSGWRAPDGARLPLGELPLLDDELCPPDVFDGVEPDALHFSGATGNEGASFERSYRRAALVLWPRARRLDAIGAGGLGTTLPYLEHLVGGWLRDGSASQRDDAVALARTMLAQWPQVGGHAGTHAARMLLSLAYLQDAALADAYLQDIAAMGRYAGEENAGLAQACALLPVPRATELVERIVVANASFAPRACADLLSRCSQGRSGAAAALAPAARRLADCVLGVQASPNRPGDWRRPVRLDAAAVTAIMTALRDVAAPALAERVLDHMLATCPLDAVLVEAALAVAALARQFAPAARLRGWVLWQLQARIALELAAPKDWRRASALDCRCQYCARLTLFLSDPSQAVWTLKAAEVHRRHVADMIRAKHCDLDCQTVRQGSPHGLVCTKNQASYEARVLQRVADVKLAAQLLAEN